MKGERRAHGTRARALTHTHTHDLFSPHRWGPNCRITVLILRPVIKPSDIKKNAASVYVMFYRHTHKHYKKAKRESREQNESDGRQKEGGREWTERGRGVLRCGGGGGGRDARVYTHVDRHAGARRLHPLAAVQDKRDWSDRGENFEIGFQDFGNWVSGPKKSGEGYGCTQRGECGEALSRIEVES